MTDTTTPPAIAPKQRAELVAELRVDEKWSVQYDPQNNDCPKTLLRYGEIHPVGPDLWTNDQVAMFYAMLENFLALAAAQAEIARLTAALATARADGMREGAESLRKTWWRGELTSDDFGTIAKGATT